MKSILWEPKTAVLTGRTHYMDARGECSIEIHHAEDGPGTSNGKFPFLVVHRCSVYARLKTLDSAKRWARKLRLKLGKEAEK